MKGLLILCLCVALFSPAQGNSLRGEPFPKLKESTVNMTLDLIHGFLMGIDIESGDALILIDKCIQDVPDIIGYIEEFIADIESIKNFDDIQKLLTVIAKLFKVVESLFQSIDVACVKTLPGEYEEIINLIQAFQNFTIKHWSEVLVNDLFFHGAEVFNLLMDLPASWKKSNYTEFGMDLGELIYVLVFGFPPKSSDLDIDVKEGTLNMTIDLITGFLMGIDIESGDALILIDKCIQDVPDVIGFIEEFIADIESIKNFHDIQKILTVIAKLFNVVESLFQSIDVACVKTLPGEYEEIINLIQAFQNFTIKHWSEVLVNDLFFHGAQVFSLLMDLPASWKKSNYTEFGMDLGELIYVLVFGFPPKSSDLDIDVKEGTLNMTIDLITGFLMGIDIESGDALILIDKCIQDVPDVIGFIEEFIADIESIKNFHDIQKILTVIAKLFNVVESLFQSIDVACVKTLPGEYEEIINLIQAFQNFTIKHWSEVLVNDLFFHGAQVFSLLMDLPASWKKSNYTEFGMDLGELIYVLVFGFPPKKSSEVNEGDPVKNVMDFMIGFLEGVDVESGDAVKLIEDCVKGGPDVIGEIEKDIQEIKNISNFHDIQVLMKVFTDLFASIERMLQDVEPCARTMPDEYAELIKVIDAFKAFSIQHWVQVLVNDLFFHGAQIYKMIAQIPGEVKDGDYHGFGMDIGELLYVVLFGF